MSVKQKLDNNVTSVVELELNRSSDMNFRIGDEVKWTRSRKSLGIIIHFFYHEGERFAVVKSVNIFKVVRVYEELVLVKRKGD